MPNKPMSNAEHAVLDGELYTLLEHAKQLRATNYHVPSTSTYRALHGLEVVLSHATTVFGDALEREHRIYGEDHALLKAKAEGEK